MDFDIRFMAVVTRVHYLVLTGYAFWFTMLLGVRVHYLVLSGMLFDVGYTTWCQGLLIGARYCSSQKINMYLSEAFEKAEL